MRWLLILALLPVGCSLPTGDPPNIVLIVLDTVRRDHLSSYGYFRETSPQLEAFRKNARTYTRAYSTSSWTVPAHASIFTGLFPVRHGATQENDQLGAEFETLAEILRAGGYQTVGITGNPMIGLRRGFGRGFDLYRESWKIAPKRNRDLVTLDWIERFLKRRTDEKPLFLFVNLIGAHAPFASCEDNCGAFGAEIIPGGLNDSLWKQYYQGQIRFTRQNLDRLVRLYDAEIRQVDSTMGQILDAIDLHLSPETDFVAITSDHGENFGEHQHINHVFSIHETTIQIPMIIRYPGRAAAGSEDARATQLLDLFPTILRAAGIDRAANRHHGMDLFGDWDVERPILSEYYHPDQAIGRIYAEASPKVRKQLEPYRRRLRSLTLDGWKLIWGSDGRHELYDLAEDPKELENLIRNQEAAKRGEVLQKKLDTLIAHYGATPEPLAPGTVPETLLPLDPETEAELRELGYIE